MCQSAQARPNTAASKEQATESKRELIQPVRLPLHRRLRFRMAAASAFGMALFLIVYALLMTWAVSISTQAALHDRQAVAGQMAVMVDDLIGLALNQTRILAGQFAEDYNGAISTEEAKSLTNSVDLMSTLESAGVISNDGRMIWSTEKPGDDPGAWLASPALSRVLTDDAPGVAPAPQTEGHRHLAILAFPLHDSKGSKVGALVGTIQLGNMATEILPKEETGLLAEVIDTEGLVLASSSGNATRLIPAHLALLSDAISRGVPKAAIHEGNGWEGHVVAFAPFRNISGGIVVEQAADVALAVPRSLQRVGFFIGLGILAVFSFGVWRYIGQITRPFEELSAVSNMMAQGSFDRAIVVRSENELGLLARSLEAMRISLKAAWEHQQHWLQDLEMRVEERTQEVHRLLGRTISAQEEERKRVARELHDGAAQYMATLLVSLDRLGPSHKRMDGSEQELWTRVQEEARNALVEVRQLISDLRPAVLDDLGLVAAIRWYAEKRLQAAGISLSFETSGVAQKLSPSLESTLFRIGQEAVSNVIKHANARRVGVQLTFTEDSVSVTVEDDGVGFNPETVAQGLGLASMRERASLAGGVLCIDGRAHGGTRIVVTVPISGNSNV